MSNLEWLVLVGFAAVCFVLYRIHEEIRAIRTQGEQQSDALTEIQDTLRGQYDELTIIKINTNPQNG